MDGTDSDDDEGPDEEQRAARRLDQARRKLESSAGKLIVIAGISVLLPGLGALTGAFALYASGWSWRRSRALETRRGVQRSLLALALSLGALGLQGVWVWLWLRS